MQNTDTTKTAERQPDNVRVELRGVKYAAFASQETSCFSASVYINGVKEGSVENQGCGGSNFYHPHTLNDKLSAIAGKLPDIECYGQTLKQDADILIGDLLNAFLQRRDLKRVCAKKTCFRLLSETYNDGEYRTVKAPFSEKVKNYLVNKYAQDLGEILNEQLA